MKLKRIPTNEISVTLKEKHVDVWSLYMRELWALGAARIREGIIFETPQMQAMDTVVICELREDES